MQHIYITDYQWQFILIGTTSVSTNTQNVGANANRCISQLCIYVLYRFLSAFLRISAIRYKVLNDRVFPQVCYRTLVEYKDTKTRPHTDNFWENSAKCLRTIEICSFVPDSSNCGFWPFLRELGKQIATYPLPFPGWKRGLEIASISTFHILFITAWNDVSCYVYHANLVIFFRIRKKDRVCLLGEGPYSPFRYIFHAIHLLAI